MNKLGGPRALSPEDKVVLAARPAALTVARIIAGVWGVRSRTLIEDCEQAACQAQLEALPRYDPSRGSFETFQWKRVAGAVTKLLRRELARGRTGFDDALDEADTFEVETDPFAPEDMDDMSKLKAMCRVLTFRRVMGDARASFESRPDTDALRAEVFGILRHALGELSDREMLVLDLHFWQDLTWEEVGRQVSLSDRQAKRIALGVRKRLERDLRKKGVDEAPPSVNTY